jgi:hypothetical protein
MRVNRSPHWLATLAIAAGPLPGCTLRLTEERVLQDLGRDELTFTLPVFRDECVADALARCRSEKITAVGQLAEEVAAFKGSGWVEPVCENEPGSIKLSPAGRQASVRWKIQREEGRPCNELEVWRFVVARYDRTGPPVIRPGTSATERLVTIPGRWIPNEDGKRLVAAGYPPIVTVNRQERFTYDDGVWARHHPGR